MTESVFDLALMATVKVVSMVVLLPYLENYSNKQIDSPSEQRLKKFSRLLCILLILFGIIFLAYSSTKGGLVLYAFLNDSDYKRMHATYNALVISAFCFSFVECLFVLWSPFAMNRLKSVRILHRLNDKGQEIDKDGKPIEKKVDMKRLLKLAKPVS